MENKLSKNSSLLVSKTAICVWTVFFVLSAVAGYAVLSGLFLFFLLLFSFVRYWSAKAMEGVSLEISCENRFLFPGMQTEIQYGFKNDKFLPLMWLELSQQAPEKECLVPDKSFEPYCYLKDVGEKIAEINALRRSFSLIMGYESMTLSSTWHAVRRGIYCPEELLLRSGDGFGLCQVERYYPSGLLPEIVVYPKRVPVDWEMFLRQDWDKNYGAVGFKEDMSVLRGIRPYAITDSWKRINWRMAARQPGELQVNYYETVQPATAMFVLDGESYCDNAGALESDLEIIASLIEQLSSKGVNCGLSLPKSKSFPAVNFSPARQLSAAELMYYLAGFDCLKNPVLDKDKQPTGKYYPSAFEYSALFSSYMEAGTISLFTNKASEIPAKLLEIADHGRLTVFSSGTLDCPDKELKLMPVSSLRKGGTQ